MRRWGGVLPVVLVATMAGCGGGPGRGFDGRGAPGQGPDRSGRSTVAHPVRVEGQVPGDALLVAAGRGRGNQTWDQDETGSDEPYTVLAPNGSGGDDPRRILVSLSGYRGYQGGLDQASHGYQRDDLDHFSLDGRRAIYAPHTETGPDLVVVISGGRALRVTGPKASRRQLEEIARRSVAPSGHRRAPTVPHPPRSWHVVGSVDAGLQTFEPGTVSFKGGPDAVPGPKGGYAVQWQLDDGLDPMAVLTVASLPGTTGDPEALTSGGTGWYGRVQVRRPTVQGRPAVFLTGIGPYPASARRLVAFVADNGDLVVVTAPAGRITDAQLLDVAGRVRPATAAQWRATIEATGGGGALGPTPGSVEVQRGRTADVWWLLQATPRGSGSAGGAGSCPSGSGLCREGPSGPDAGFVVEPCLKVVGVPDGVCPATGNAPHAVALEDPERRPPDLVAAGTGEQQVLGHAFPAFSVVQTWDPAARTVRVLTAVGPVEEPLVPVAGSASRAAVVFAAPDPAVTACAVDPGLPPPSPASGASHPAVRILDAQGRVVSCLGAGR